MKKEKLRNNHKKEVLIGGMIILLIITIIFLNNKEQNNILIKDNLKTENTIAMYKSDDGTNYTEIQEMPEGNYIINEEKSYCTLDNKTHQEGISLKTIDENHTISGLKKTSKCYIWFDKKKDPTSEDTLAKLNITNINTTTPDFSKTATTDEGVFKVADGMYGRYSYYFRGAVTNNHVIFANKCWRIVRINGDGSIRLIYNGAVLIDNKCTGNGIRGGIALSGKAYNGNKNNNSFVGWTYKAGYQRPSATTEEGVEEQNSNAKNQLEVWFSTNITGTNADKVADGKFCNDRNTKNNEEWRATGAVQYYAAFARLYDAKTPTLSCPIGDVYTVKVGAITADEVAYAGGKSKESNSSFYLYNGNNYWTMSPYGWGSTNTYARVFTVDAGGDFEDYNVNSTYPGLRPVINLRSDVSFSSGNGLQSSPFVVN